MIVHIGDRNVKKIHPLEFNRAHIVCVGMHCGDHSTYTPLLWNLKIQMSLKNS